MTWEALAIAAAFIWAVTNIIDKYVLEKFVEKALLPVIALGVIGLLASIIVFITPGVQYLPPAHIFLALVGGSFYIITILCYFYALKAEETSRVIALFYFTPLFILLFAAFFLGEVLTPGIYAGIISLVAGAMLISWDGKFGLSSGKALGLMILASIASAFTHVITKYLLSFTDFWTIFAYIRIGAFIALVPFIVVSYRSFASLYREKGLIPFALMSLSEFLNNIALLVFTLAASLGLITLVSGISSVQPFFVFLMTILISLFYPTILREDISKQTLLLKFSAIALMFVGVLLIS